MVLELSEDPGNLKGLQDPQEALVNLAGTWKSSNGLCETTGVVEILMGTLIGPLGPRVSLGTLRFHWRHSGFIETSGCLYQRCTQE